MVTQILLLELSNHLQIWLGRQLVDELTPRRLPHFCNKFCILLANINNLILPIIKFSNAKIINTWWTVYYTGCQTEQKFANLAFYQVMLWYVYFFELLFPFYANMKISSSNRLFLVHL